MFYWLVFDVEMFCEVLSQIQSPEGAPKGLLLSAPVALSSAWGKFLVRYLEAGSRMVEPFAHHYFFCRLGALILC